MPDHTLFLLGLVGGVLAEFVAIARHRRDKPKDFPQHFKSKFYWFVSACWLVVGGVVAVLTLNGASDIARIVPVQAGATAPLFLERLLATLPEAPVGNVG